MNAPSNHPDSFTGGVKLTAGKSHEGAGGGVQITGGQSHRGVGGSVVITSGASNLASSGGLTLKTADSGKATSDAGTGAVLLTSGKALNPGSSSGGVLVTSGDAPDGRAGDVVMKVGHGTSGKVRGLDLSACLCVRYFVARAYLEAPNRLYRLHKVECQF